MYLLSEGGRMLNRRNQSDYILQVSPGAPARYARRRTGTSGRLVIAFNFPLLFCHLTL